MSWRTLFDPGSLYPYRPPSIPLSLAMMLLGAICCIPLVSLILEYRELRYGTVVTSGVVENVVNRVNDTTTGRWGTTRRYVESVVIYAFVTPDGIRRGGLLTYPAIRMEHLKRGAPVKVYYKADNPDRSTTADGLHMRLWWGLIPGSVMAILWFGLLGVFIRQALRPLHPEEPEVTADIDERIWPLPRY
jgi:hypothetical protein